MQRIDPTWFAFLAMAFAVVGLTGAFASFAAPLPLHRALTREAALDDALIAVSAPDPKAALEALRPRLGDSAAALLPIAGDMTRANWAAMGSFIAFCAWLYNWKSGGFFSNLWYRNHWFPTNLPGLLAAAGGAIAAQAKDPSTLIGTLAISAAGPSFYYTLAYSVVVVLFGIRRKRTYLLNSCIATGIPTRGGRVAATIGSNQQETAGDDGSSLLDFLPDAGCPVPYPSALSLSQFGSFST